MVQRLFRVAVVACGLGCPSMVWAQAPASPAATPKETFEQKANRQFEINFSRFLGEAGVTDAAPVVRAFLAMNARIKKRFGDNGLALAYFSAEDRRQSLSKSQILGLQIAWEDFNEDVTSEFSAAFDAMLREASAQGNTGQEVRKRAALKFLPGRSPLPALSFALAFTDGQAKDFSPTPPLSPPLDALHFDGHSSVGAWMFRFDPTYENLRQRLDRQDVLERGLKNAGYGEPVIAPVLRADEEFNAAWERQRLAGGQLLRVLLDPKGSDEAVRARLAFLDEVQRQTRADMDTTMERLDQTVHFRADPWLLLALRVHNFLPIYGDYSDSYEGAYWMSGRTKVLGLG